MGFVQSCPPMEVIFGGFCEAIVKRSCGAFSFLVFDCWCKLERLKREPTNVGSQEILEYYTYIYSFLVRATFGQLS